MNVTSPPPLETVSISRYGEDTADEDSDTKNARAKFKVSQVCMAFAIS